MKKEIYICDKCGERFEVKEGEFAVGLGSVSFSWGIGQGRSRSIDLCEKCYKNLEKWLKNN